MDSLLQLAKAHQQEDGVKLRLLNDIAFEYNFTEPEKGIETADRAILLAKSLDDNVGLASAYSNKGVNYAALGDDSSALHMYRTALEIYTREDNFPGMARIYNNMAIVLVGISNYADALDYYTKSFSVFEKLDNKPQMARSLNNMGVVYLYLADYPKALEYYLKALTILESSDDDYARANSLSNIGIVYKNLFDYKKALEFHNEALELYTKTGNRQGIANTLGNIGVVYDNSNDPKLAVEYYRKALAINNVLGNKKRIASDLINIGVALQNLDDPAGAKDHFERALALCKSSGDKNTLAIVLNQLGDLYANVPDSVFASISLGGSSRFGTALEYFENSLAVARETGAVDRQSETWENLSGIYEKMKLHDKALEAYKQYIVFRDSIHNVENGKRVTRTEMEFEFQKKEALAAARIENERILRNAAIGVAIILLVAAISTFIFYKRKVDAEKTRKAAEFRATVASTEMKALRLQMNPHFIFNALNSISDYISRNNVDQANYYLVKFSKLMRTTLENSEHSEVGLAADLEALEYYMQLESLRSGNKFSYSIKVDEDVDTENTMVPPMLFQPFVENSIVHGFTGKNVQGHISIHVQARDERVHYVIEDNGVGLAQAKNANSFGSSNNKKSMGLKITRERIDIINRTRKTNASMEITDTGRGTRATVILPLQLSI
ncbi:MAG: tetratricopeptide repeat protein [Chitinophagaceae bacterium]|nr:tetratricopeptide repeat protein [Chitinophagaceae bacterium]